MSFDHTVNNNVVVRGFTFIAHIVVVLAAIIVFRALFVTVASARAVIAFVALSFATW